MPVFDPKSPPKGDPGKDDSIPAGDYLLVVKSFKRATGKQSGQPYLRARIEVIDGGLKGRSFFDSITLDMTNRASIVRLSMLTEQTEAGAFNTDDDADCRRAFCNKPFKARVSRTRDGKYINNGIERYLNREVTDRDREIMSAYVLDQAERQQFGGDGDGGGGGMDADGLPDAPPGTDDDYGFGGGGRRGGTKAPDDDIPF